MSPRLAAVAAYSRKVQDTQSPTPSAGCNRHSFGGWKRSGFGDLNQHGPDAVRFYTKTKTVTSRWPSGIKEGAEFVIPTMK